MSSYSQAAVRYGRAEPWRRRVAARAVRAADGVVPWVLGTAVLVVTLVDYTAEPEAESKGSAIMVCAVVSALTAAVARWRRWPLFAATAVGALLFSSWPGWVVASYYAGTTLRRTGHVAVFTAAGGAALLGVPALYHVLGGGFPLGPDDAITPTERAFSVLVLIGTPLLVGLWVGARRQVLAALAEHAQQLERAHAALAREHAALTREQAARADQARTAERARIAREMHDVVAHKVTLMVLHAGALEVAGPDDDTARTAELIRTTGRTALTDLREVLGVLRSPHSPPPDPRAPAPGLADLDRLLDASRALGLRVTRPEKGTAGAAGTAGTAGTARALPAAVERAAHRVVQESLTNVHKHADGASVEVTVRHLPGALEVVVRNSAAPEGRSAGPALPRSGLGLVGLRERLELMGGSLRAGPDPDGGFTVRARVPVAVEWGPR
ncbi:sensor histidine kinase [Streptomyces sp. G45]|uniref:sensor histidine kinase n=1 Tax=Streptomyces sp. G45 TaxID=3406627 RepID=UPI003C2282DE